MGDDNPLKKPKLSISYENPNDLDRNNDLSNNPTASSGLHSKTRDTSLPVEDGLDKNPKDASQPGDGQIKTQKGAYGKEKLYDDKMTTTDEETPPVDPENQQECENNVIKEAEDNNGFRFTHRRFGDLGCIAWQNPRFRRGGFVHVLHDPTGSSSFVKTARKNSNVFLMADHVRNWTKLVDGDWQLHEEPVKGDPELSFKYRISNFIEGSTPDLRAQKILRSLGFRPPQLSFFLITTEDLIQQRAFSHARAIRKYHRSSRYVHTAQSKPSPFDELLKQASGHIEIADAFRRMRHEMMRLRRDSLDSTGFTVFPGLFYPVHISSGDEVPKKPWMFRSNRNSPSIASTARIPTEVHNLFRFMTDCLRSKLEFNNKDIPDLANSLFACRRNDVRDPSRLSKG